MEASPWLAAAFLTTVLLTGCSHSFGTTESTRTQASSPVGTWTWPDGISPNIGYTLSVQQAGDKFTTVLREEKIFPSELPSPVIERPTANVAFENGTFTFTSSPRGTLVIVYEGKIEGDRINGTVSRRRMKLLWLPNPDDPNESGVESEVKEVWRARRIK